MASRLRCDRALPACGNCVNRGDITACYYVSQRSESYQPSNQPDNAQARIDHLEQLVLTLLKNNRSEQNQINTPSTSVDVQNEHNHEEIDLTNEGKEDEIERTTTALPKSNIININADHKERLSVNEAHWAMLLNQISEVRTHLQAQNKRYEESLVPNRSCDDSGPTLLFGSSKNVTGSEIIAQLPSKYSCDIMIARFFEHLYPALHIIHRPSFNRQYERFWEDNNKTSMAWIAILYAMLRIAMIDYLREEDEPLEFKGKCQDFANTFRCRLTDCLILADYTKPQDYIIEALCLHQYGEYVSSRDAKSTVWVLNGMITRLAMRSGFHLESQPGLSAKPFYVEMRKRVWTHLRQADVIFSFQLGLPSMFGLEAFNGPCPRNIYDDEKFDESCTSLPPTLPDSEPTQVSYLIAKSKLVFGFARALNEISHTDTMKWERVLEIDRDLRHTYEQIPEYYKLGQLSSQDSLVLVSARFVLSSIHHKALCVLHSRFLETAKADDRFLYSRKVCLSSAMCILRFQAIQNQNIPVDGKLRSLTNYQTSLTIHDYLLAVTIITADLCSNRSTTINTSQQGVPTRIEMIKALGLSAIIFGQMRDKSVEADKAADILEMLMKKFENESQGDIQSPQNVQFYSNNHRPGANSLRSRRDCLRRQTSGAQFSAISNRSSPSDLNVRPGAIRVRHQHHQSQGSSDESQDSQRNVLSIERPVSSDLSALSWSDHYVGVLRPQNPSIQTFPSFETSGSWAIPEISTEPLWNDSMGDQLGDESAQSSTNYNTIDSTMPSLSCSAATALNDPMSTLWNFTL